jgi:hypothetical protein
MMGKKNGCLKLMKDENPEMTVVHCVIHRENLVAKHISPVLNEVLNSVIECINTIKTSAKSERLFKLFCEEQNAEYVRLLLHTEVRWLSKGNSLKRFMELFDILSDFLSSRPDMKFLMTVDGRAFVSYLTDIFEKLNILNRQLQGSMKTLVDAKAKIFAFTTFIELSKKNILNNNFEKFDWLKKCEVTDNAKLVIFDHLQTLLTDFKERFADLKEINFPAWLTQPMLVDISNEQLYQEELSEMQNDDSITNLFNIKGIMAWICEEANTKYPNITLHARKLLLPFPSSYLVECGFSAISDLLRKFL